jgi:hypothetical protein
MVEVRQFRAGLTLCAGAAAAMLALCRPAEAGPPFITDDPVPVDLNHWEVYLYSAGALRQSDAAGFGPGVEVNYGAAPELQLHLIVNAAYNAPDGEATRFGPGDTELGTKYRFVDPGEHDWYPQVAIFPLLELPSGDAARGLGAGHVQAFLPVWIQKDWGKWTVYGGGGYWINPGAGNQNYWFTGITLGRQVTEKLALGAELFHQTANTIGGSASSGFNLGGVYDFTEHYHLLFSAGRGNLAYAIAGNVTNPFAYYAAFQWTF